MVTIERDGGVHGGIRGEGDDGGGFMVAFVVTSERDGGVRNRGVTVAWLG